MLKSIDDNINAALVEQMELASNETDSRNTIDPGPASIVLEERRKAEAEEAESYEITNIIKEALDLDVSMKFDQEDEEDEEESDESNK
ncbi:hypothetical protein DMENIID0001_011140 [Sergentomyia squamirostris]